MKKDIVTINGKEAVLTYRQSRSHQKEEPKLYTQKVYSILEELLRGNRSSKYKKGITTLNTLTTFDGFKLDDTRIANAIVELRKVVPKSGIITFKYLHDNVDRYALINDKIVIAFSDDLLANIKRELSLKL